MFKELKTAKWYWFIPLISLFFCYTMVKWSYEPLEDSSYRKRNMITTLNIVIVHTILCIIVKLNYEI